MTSANETPALDEPNTLETPCKASPSRPHRQGSFGTRGGSATRPLARFDTRSEIGFAGSDSALTTLRQQSPIRFLRPRPGIGDPVTGVLVNTAGGIVGGDRLAVEITVRDNAKVLVTGQAAEKIYRSSGETADLAVAINCGNGAGMEFLPQGTILYDGARLCRHTRLRVDADSQLIFGEILYFGRTAMGETFTHGVIDDRTELEWAGRRTWVDALRLDGCSANAMGSSGGLGGAVCAAMLVVVTPSPSRLLDALRSVLVNGGGDGFRTATGVFDGGPLVARWLGDDAMALRRSYAEAWCYLRAELLGRPSQMPLIWTI